MSWGIRVILLCLGFVVFMSALVYKSMQQRFDLVAEDYYSQELAYQNQMVKLNNQQESGVRIELVNGEEEFTIRFPKLSSDTAVKGTITFFRPSDSHKDIKVDIVLVNGQQTLSKQKISRGLFKVKIDYQWAGKAYYYEDTVVL